MLIFNEGVPRAGKSYDAVETHILPAIKKGRHVFARLNGLRHDLIAEFLGMPVEDVNGLLTILSEDDMPNVYKIAQPDSLVVIDECHKYYVQSLKALNPAIETFFAEHGQSGMDILLISQWYKRLHAAIRARVERKTIFQKLTAVGMQGKYLATYYHTTGPDKFEKVGKKTCKYNPAIFPLYDGYKPGTNNTEVYEAGGMTVWATVLPYLILAAVLLLVGGFFYVRYFTSKPKAPSIKPAAAAVQPAVPVVTPKASLPAMGVPAASKAPEKPKRPDMPPEVAYVWGLSDQARPRLSAVADLGLGKFAGLVEWRADQSRVLDVLSVDQLRSLGVTVERYLYGLKLSWGKGEDRQVMIVTSWPLDQPYRYSDQQMSDIREQGPLLPPLVREPSPYAPAPVSAAAVSSRSRGGVGSQSYTPPTMGEWNSDPFGRR